MNEKQLQAMRLTDGTFFEDMLCTCEHYQASHIVAITGSTEVMPNVPPCKECGGIPWEMLDSCVECKELFYRWFQVPETFNTTGRACFNCTLSEAFNRSGIMWTRRHGAIKPPANLIPVPPTVDSVSDKMDALFAMLGE